MGLRFISIYNYERRKMWMSNRLKIKKTEQEIKLCVERLRKSINDQYGISLREWIQMEKEKMNDNSNGKSRTQG